MWRGKFSSEAEDSYELEWSSIRDKLEAFKLAAVVT